MSSKSIMNIEPTDMDEYQDFLTDQAAARFMSGEYTHVNCEGEDIEAAVVQDVTGRRLVMLGDMAKICPTI